MTTAVTTPAISGLPVVQSLPTNIVGSGILSPTSLAVECYINQRFSGKLQAFLVSYVNGVYSDYSVYAV